MPGWFVQLAALAVLGLLGASNGDWVASSIMVTGGLMIPVWTLAVNLWWITLVLAPFAVLKHRGAWIRGSLISAVIAAALAVFPTLYITQQRLAVVPVVVNSSNLLPLPDRFLSMEMTLTDNRADLHTCTPLCQQWLLGGDLQWIRMMSAPDARLAQRSIVYYRAGRADCAEVDPDFPAKGDCLLARPDDGARADLQMHLTELGDFHTPMDPNAGVVALTGVQKVTLTDMRDARVLLEQSRYGWVEPMVGFLEPKVQITNTVTADGGFRLHQMRHYTAPIDLRGALLQVGVRAAPPRDMMPTGGDVDLSWQHGPYLSRLPYDTALQDSMVAVAQGKPVPKGTYAERMMASMPGLAAAIAPRARKVAPNRPPADDDFAGWLAQIGQGGMDGFRAMNIVGDMMQGAPPGAFDAHGDAFLAALPAAPGLTPLLGRFAFDPVPHLRGLWTKGVDEEADVLALRAACDADERWSARLAPFVFEAAQSLFPRHQDPKFFGYELQLTVQVLTHLQRPDLAQAVADGIDWDVVAGLSPRATFGTFPPVTRALLMDRISKPIPCH